MCMPCRCVPSLFSAEAGLILVQGGLLVTRTLITDAISRIEARAARYLIAQASPPKDSATLFFLPGRGESPPPPFPGALSRLAWLQVIDITYQTVLLVLCLKPTSGRASINNRKELDDQPTPVTDHGCKLLLTAAYRRRALEA